MRILGINYFFEHSSVAIIEDGVLMFSAEEERFNKIKGGKRYDPFSLQFPFRAIYAGLKYLDITIDDIDTIAFSYNKWKHLFGCLSTKRWSFYDDMIAFGGLLHLERAFCSNYEIFQYMTDRLTAEGLAKIPMMHFDHHASHAASAYCYSGFNKSIVLAADCCGEKGCTSIYVASEKGMKKIKSFNVPNSLGIMYATITKHLGFNMFMDEYKVMGLASYGKDSYRKEFRNFIQYDKNGNYVINKKNLFRLGQFLGPARKPNEPITNRHKDIAKTAQAILEDILINMLFYYRKKTGIKNLCMAGGIALNCVANGKISEKHIFDNIFVQPASSDAGTAMGAAALANFKMGGKMQVKFDDMYLGTEYSNEQIEEKLKVAKLKYRCLSDEAMVKLIAKYLAEGKVGGLFRGRMEAGPRALGNRSVIASPIPDDMLEKVNRIKSREEFRPIAPIVKEDKFNEYFTGTMNQYMIFTCKVKSKARDKIKAVTHVDGTSRVQTVTRKSNKFIYSLIDEFENLTGVPIIVNTSLNFYGHPIVESPVDAIGGFYTSGLDFLVIGQYLLIK